VVAQALCSSRACIERPSACVAIAPSVETVMPMKPLAGLFLALACVLGIAATG